MGAQEIARELIEQVIEESAAAGNTRFEGWSRIYLALISLHDDQPDTAEREALAAAALLEVSPPARAGALAALARIRSEEGYMAMVETEAPGRFLLVENHCPICAAASACQGLCRDELTLFRKVLGKDARVERVEHMLSGSRRCVYRIEPRSAGRGAG